MANRNKFCAWCEEPIRSGKYCGAACYGKARSSTRDSDRCKVCLVRRDSLGIMGRIFTKKVCQQCYASVKEFSGRTDLIAVNTFRKRLLSAIHHGRGRE